MAQVLSVKELFDGESNAGKTVDRATRKLIVEYDEERLPSDVAAVTRHPAVPTKGQAHPRNGLLFARNIRHRAAGPYRYEVTCDYDSSLTILEARHTIRWGGVDGEEAVTVDVDDRPIRNSAGTWYGEPLRRAIGQDAFEIGIKEKELPGLGISHTVNSDPIWGAEPGTLKLGRVSASSLPRGEAYKWLVVYPFVYKAEGWNPRVLDTGYKYLADVLDEDGTKIGEEWKNFEDSEGNTFAEPSLLDGAGGKLEPGGEPVYSDPVKLYRSRSFAELELPSPFERP